MRIGSLVITVLLGRDRVVMSASMASLWVFSGISDFLKLD